jgi:hypothetical protein
MRQFNETAILKSPLDLLALRLEKAQQAPIIDVAGTNEQQSSWRIIRKM